MTHKFMRITFFASFVFFIFVVTPFMGLCIYIYIINDDLPAIEDISQFKYLEPMKIYDINGDIIAELGQERRYPIEYSSMPAYLGKAVVAVEDSRFYLHSGIDILGIMRAFVTNVRAGKIVEGGSTLTQQLVKIIYLNPEKKLKRKIKEAILAYKLDRYLTKEQILELYLNQVNFGRGGYGVKAAALNYFKKEVSELTLAEAALIAGIPKAPGYYSPHISIERAKSRRNHVLFRMFTIGYISKDQYTEAINEPIVITETVPLKLKYAGYFVDSVKKYITDELGIDNAQELGLKIYTTLNIKHQIAAENAVSKNLVKVAKREGYYGVLYRADNISNMGDNNSDIIDNDDLNNELAKSGITDLDKIPRYLKSMDFFKATVIGVSKKNVKIDVNGIKGTLRLGDNRWAKHVKGTSLQLKDFNNILQLKDIIYVSKHKKDEGIYLLEQDPQLESAMISIDPSTGNILAMVGGFSYDKSFFNRAVQAERQSGSAFKPIVYATALESGIVPMDIILDAPVISEEDADGNVWKPKNFGDKFYGPTTVKEALVKSRNVVTVKLAEMVGIRKILKYAKLFGISSDMPRDFSIALGSASSSLIDMALVYSTFAKGGVRPTQSRFITRIESINGDIIYEAPPVEMMTVIKPETAMMINDMLQSAVDRGTGWRAKRIGRPVAGKTGTSNGPKDTWFAVYMPNLVTITWTGYDDFKNMGHYATGASSSSLQAVEYNLDILKELPYATFPTSDKVAFFKVSVDDRVITNSISDDYTFEPYPLDDSGNPILPRDR